MGVVYGRLKSLRLSRKTLAPWGRVELTQFVQRTEGKPSQLQTSAPLFLSRKVRANKSVSNLNGMDTGPETRQYSGQTSTSIPVTSPTTNPRASSRRRRTSTTGRGVAHLTPEQLNKKRANDREAQRAIRERTKVQIERLEGKIQELTSQKPYLELQDALRQKEQVEAENEEIKKKLNSVLGIIQPIVGGNGVVGKASYT